MGTRRANGEGTLKYDEERKYWIAKISTSQGRKTFYGKTKAEAIEKRENYKLTGRKTKGNKSSSLTLRETIQKGIDLKFEQGIIGENTYCTNMSTLNIISASTIANKYIDEIVDTDIQEFLLGITNYSESTIKKIYEEINLAFNYAKTLKIIKDNPIKDNMLVKKPKSKQKKEKVIALKLEEEKKLLNIIEKYPHQYSDIWLICIYMGLRIGEVCALLKKDVNIEKMSLHIHRTITKNKEGKEKIGKIPKTEESDATIPIPDTLIATLQNVVNSNTESNLLFPSFNGEYDWISPKAIYSALQRYIKKYEICDKCTLHMLRHTFATRLIEADVPPKVVQHLLRHKSIQTTLDTYTDVFKELEDKNMDTINNLYLEINNTNILDEKILANKELNKILEIVDKSHFTEPQKELLYNDLIKIKEWLELA